MTVTLICSLIQSEMRGCEDEEERKKGEDMKRSGTKKGDRESKA